MADDMGALSLYGQDEEAPTVDTALTRASFPNYNRGPMTAEQPAPTGALSPKYIQDRIDRGDEDVRRYSAEEDAAYKDLDADKRNKMAKQQEIMESVSNQQPDRTRLLAAISAGFLKPTRTGGFAESLGNVGEYAQAPLSDIEKFRQDQKKQVQALGLSGFDLSADMSKDRAALARSRAERGYKMTDSGIKMLELNQKLDEAATRSREQLKSQELRAQQHNDLMRALAGDRNATAVDLARIRAGSPSITPDNDTLTGEEFLATLPVAKASQVRGLLSGDQTFTGINSKSRQELLALANQTDPSFDMSTYATRTATKKDLTSGQTGKNIMALNTAVHHMDTLRRNYQSMNNSGSTPWNYVGNTFSQLGDSGPLDSFESAKTAVATELAKAFHGVGALSDKAVEEWTKNVKAAKTPDTMKEVMRTWAELLHGRLSAIDSYALSTLGEHGKKNIQIMSPESAALLEGFRDGSAWLSDEERAAKNRDAVKAVLQNARGGRINVR